MIDEYVVLFGEDDRIAFQASEALGALVMRGRSFGIHVLLSAQRPASSFLSMAQIKSQMGLRIAFKCRPEDSTLILGEGNERAARLSQRGEACVTADPDIPSATVQVKTARVTAEDRTLYLQGLQQFAKLQKYTRPLPVIVFRRDAPANWLESAQTVRRLQAPKWTPHPVPAFWLGQPLRIADDVTVTLDPQQGANLLTVGTDEALAERILQSAVLGLNLTLAPKRTEYLVIGTVDPQNPPERNWTLLQATLPESIRIVSRQAAVDALSQVGVEMDKRLVELPNKPDKRIIIVVAGLHRWGEARGPNSYTPSMAGEQLCRICQLGPQVGIHALLWADRLGTLSAVVGGAAQQELLAQLSHRVGLQMNTDESINFLGIPQAAKLGSERAFYRNERWASEVMEKFKPYTLPMADQLMQVVETIRTHW